jgi:hypothetical protein
MKRKKKYTHKQINVNIVGGVRDYLFEGEDEKYCLLLVSSQASPAHPSDRRSMNTKKRNVQTKAV